MWDIVSDIVWQQQNHYTIIFSIFQIADMDYVSLQFNFLEISIDQKLSVVRK